jgi:putative hydrolases of HD superfamily
VRPNESLLDLFLELQALDRVPRSGYALRGVTDPESVTEHSWHVLFMVWALGSRLPGVDVAHAVELALVHDLAELRIGDLPRTAGRYLPPGAKRTAEAAALDEILAPLGERGQQLHAEYEEGATLEARLVKGCDKLQLMVKVAVYESWGQGALAEFWDNPDNFPAAGIPALDEILAELRKRRGR